MDKEAIKCPSCGEYIPLIQKASRLRLQLNLAGIIPGILFLVRALMIQGTLQDRFTDPIVIISLIVSIIFCVLAEKQGAKVKRMKNGKYW
jgi:hypothetical protein